MPIRAHMHIGPPSFVYRFTGYAETAWMSRELHRHSITSDERWGQPRGVLHHFLGFCKEEECAHFTRQCGRFATTLGPPTPPPGATPSDLTKVLTSPRGLLQLPARF